jgi:hypothetical protein
MSDIADISNRPHRVIFRSTRSVSSRAFPNRARADEFVATLKDWQLILVQLASDPMPTNLNTDAKPFKQMAVLNKCACGRSKFTADKHCGACKGVGLR